MIVVTLGVIEAIAWVTYYLSYGETYRRDQLLAVAGGEAAITRVEDRFRPHRVSHPFYGYTPASPNRDLNAMPPPRRRPGTVVIGLLGGSVALGVTSSFEKAVQEHFSDNVAGLEPVVVKLAWNGMKQPQQLMIVANMLLYGGEFDIIVNLDGLNEIDGWKTNVKNGTFPFFPNYWSKQVTTTAEETLLVGRIAVLRDEQNALLYASGKSLLRWSAVFGLTVRFRLERTESSIRALHHELTETKTRYSLEQHGPRWDFQDRADILQFATENWYRGSKLLMSLASQNGAEYYHFLQPNQYLPGSKPLSDEELESAYDLVQGTAGNVRKAYPVLIPLGGKLKSEGIKFFDLTMIFADNRETLYRDVCCHFNKRGYELLADHILRRILEATNIAALKLTP